MLMEFAITAAKRSTCNRKKVGAIVAIDGRPIAAGYAGSLPGEPHCIDVGCLIGPNGGCVRTRHAERNVLDFLERRGVRYRGADLYCTLSPCIDCAELIVRSEIKRVFYLERYRMTEPLDYLLAFGINSVHYAPQS